MQKNVLIGIVVAVVLAVGLFWFFFLRQPSIEPLEQEQGLGRDLLQNPGTLVPETNPFKEVETNPLQGSNPFEGGYRNPFEQ